MSNRISEMVFEVGDRVIVPFVELVDGFYRTVYHRGIITDFQLDGGGKLSAIISSVPAGLRWDGCGYNLDFLQHELIVDRLSRLA